MLTDEKVLALKTVLVENNEKVKAIRQCLSYEGRGNSNHSASTNVVFNKFELEEIADEEIKYFNPFEKLLSNYVYEIAIAAVVDDVIYLIEKNNYLKESKVVQLPFGEFYLKYEDVAYDTLGCSAVYALGED